MHIRQVAAFLSYGKPQVLQVFKNTLPSRLYWVLFPVEDLRQAVETTERILTKANIDRQLVVQSLYTPFMNIQDGYNSNKRVVTFDTQHRLDDKLDKITSMMSKLTAQGSSQKRPFKPKIYQGKRRGQAENYYEQDRYQNRYRSSSGNSRLSYRDRAQYGQNNKGRSQYDQNYRGDSRRENFRGTHNYRGQNLQGGYRGNFRNDNFGRDRSRSRERQYSDNFRRNERSNIRSRSGSRTSTNREIGLDTLCVGSTIILLKIV